MSKYKYTCWHCGTGMVRELPARCPECNRMLTEPVKRKSKNRP